MQWHSDKYWLLKNHYHTKNKCNCTLEKEPPGLKTGNHVCFQKKKFLKNKESIIRFYIRENARH